MGLYVERQRKNGGRNCRSLAKNDQAMLAENNVRTIDIFSKYGVSERRHCFQKDRWKRSTF
jgi:hypothetical protein